MTPRTKLAAGMSAALLAFGLAACEADPEALDDLEGDPGVEEGDGL